MVAPRQGRAPRHLLWWRGELALGLADPVDDLLAFLVGQIGMPIGFPVATHVYASCWFGWFGSVRGEHHADDGKRPGAAATHLGVAVAGNAPCDFSAAGRRHGRPPFFRNG